jgi:hypothetical protein
MPSRPRSHASSLSRLLALCGATAFAFANGPVFADDAAAKKAVRSQDDLPRFTYPIAGTATALADGDAATFEAFAKPVRADLEGTLNNYDIEDHAALRGLLGEELYLQILSGNEDAAAARTLERIRSLEDKPDAKLTFGLTAEAVLEARKATHAASGPAFEAAFQKAIDAGRRPKASINAIVRETVERSIA